MYFLAAAAEPKKLLEKEMESSTLPFNIMRIPA